MQWCQTLPHVPATAASAIRDGMQDKKADDVEGLFDRARQAGAVDGTQADLRPGGGGGAGWLPCRSMLHRTVGPSKHTCSRMLQKSVLAEQLLPMCSCARTSCAQVLASCSWRSELLLIDGYP